MDEGFKVLVLPQKLPKKTWILRNVVVFLNITVIIGLTMLAFSILIFILVSLTNQATIRGTPNEAFLNILAIILGSLVIWVTAQRIKAVRERWEKERTWGLTKVFQQLIEEWVNYNYIYRINLYEARRLMLSAGNQDDLITFNQLPNKPDFYEFGRIRKQQPKTRGWIEISLVWQLDKYLLAYTHKAFKEVPHRVHEFNPKLPH